MLSILFGKRLKEIGNVEKQRQKKCKQIKKRIPRKTKLTMYSWIISLIAAPQCSWEASKGGRERNTRKRIFFFFFS